MARLDDGPEAMKWLELLCKTVVVLGALATIAAIPLWVSWRLMERI